jgi:hypothetical protein
VRTPRKESLGLVLLTMQWAGAYIARILNARKRAGSPDVVRRPTVLALGRQRQYGWMTGSSRPARLHLKKKKEEKEKK